MSLILPGSKSISWEEYNNSNFSIKSIIIILKYDWISFLYDNSLKIYPQGVSFKNFVWDLYKLLISMLFISFFNNDVIIYNNCSSLLFFDKIFSYKLFVKKWAK